MDSIRNHRDLIAWQKAMDLAVEVYRLAEKLPMREAYGIYSQTTRAAASVPANIAEGHGRQGAKEFANFLSISRGSLAEVDTFLELPRRLNYLAEAGLERANGLADEVGRLTTALRQSLLRRP
ncbi:MAG: four helix bundle protein [Dehalococcoidia bacterium]|uniref:four helix bundle protein n=1 Tax=Candidatus Amarobacter glycogenicus TaxID=3140699 RepID=UPI003136F472|nr:four helix bundle protein [Dehalococcoidia bacterium]